MSLELLVIRNSKKIPCELFTLDTNKKKDTGIQIVCKSVIYGVGNRLI